MNSKLRKKSRHLGALVLMMSMVLGAGWMSKAHAAGSDTVGLKVTVGVSLSVAIGTSTYDFGGSMVANQTAISTGAIPVTNNSAGLTEDYQIYGSSTANWNPGISTNTGTDFFNLRVLISTQGYLVPGYSEFATTNTGLLDGAVNSVNMKNAAMGEYSDNTQGTGNNVPAGTTKYLWFRLITPANLATGNNTQQSITVTVVAANSSTYTEP